MTTITNSTTTHASQPIVTTYSKTLDSCRTLDKAMLAALEKTISELNQPSISAKEFETARQEVERLRLDVIPRHFQFDNLQIAAKKGAFPNAAEIDADVKSLRDSEKKIVILYGQMLGIAAKKGIYQQLRRGHLTTHYFTTDPNGAKEALKSLSSL